MKNLIILLVVPFLSVSECGKKKNTIPSCLEKMITERTKEIPPNPPEQIDEYLYNGKTVYLVTAPCCDQFNVVYDENCKEICAPSGGITGKGDGKCEDFSKTAQYVKLIWKKKKE